MRNLMMQIERITTAVGTFSLCLLASPSGAQNMTTPAPAQTASSTTVPAKERATTADSSIRSFRIGVPQDALMELKRRVNATRWPDKETVSDRSQGAQLASMEELVRYWGTGYDWRKVEAKLNSYPQFITNIDGVDIQFIQV